MERVPNIESLEQAPDLDLDLLEAFADREVTIFGITGSFKDLAGMCPVDLSDPRVTLEAKNDFVVKAANEAGLAIEPEHEATFARVTEKHGLERKFTIAEPPAPAKESPSILSLAYTKVKDSPMASAKLQVAQAVAQSNIRDSPVALDQQNVAPEIILAAHKPAEMSEIPLPDEAALQDTAEIPQTALPVHDLLERIMQEAQVRQPEPESAVAPERIVESAEADARISFDKATLLAVAPAPLEARLADVPVDVTFDALIAPLSTEYTAEAVPLFAESSSEVAQVGWADELALEPSALYEDFAGALQVFSELPEASIMSGEDEPLEGAVEFRHDELTESDSAPPIAAEISAHLAELGDEEREVAAPILKSIVGAVHGLQLLEARSAAPEVVVAVEVQLEALCIALFEVIGVEPSKENIKRFVYILRHPKFQPPQPEVVGRNMVDLEHEGTHEAKQDFAHLAGTISGVEREAERLLGKLVVFYTSASGQYQLAA